jgi:hypothetical protein
MPVKIDGNCCNNKTTNEITLEISSLSNDSGEIVVYWVQETNKKSNFAIFLFTTTNWLSVLIIVQFTLPDMHGFKGRREGSACDELKSAEKDTREVFLSWKSFSQASNEAVELSCTSETLHWFQCLPARRASFRSNIGKERNLDWSRQKGLKDS